MTAEMPRDVAATVPLGSIGVSDFEQVLIERAALWKHAQFQ